MRSRQSGVTLLELMLVIGLMAVGTVIAMNEKQSDLEVQKARVVGNYLFEYNNAARSWLSKNPGPATTTKTGTAWLKPTTCVGGQSSVAYLPCDFPDLSSSKPMNFGDLSISTTIVSSGTAPNKTTTLTTQSSPFRLGNQVRSDLSAVAAITAAAGLNDITTPVSSTTTGSFKSEPTTGIITMVASNNGAGDAWLRTDGGNTMDNNLTFNPSMPAGMRIIQNASRIQNLAAQALYLGASGGASAISASQVIVDADQAIIGKLVVQNVKGGDGIVLNQGDIRAANGNVVASGVIATNIQPYGRVSAGGDVAANGNVTAQGAVVAQGSISANGNVTAGSAVSAQIFYDANNASFYLDPSDTSRLNKVTVEGRGTFGEYVQVNGLATENTACPSNGLVGRTVAGKILSCTSGLWADPSISGSCKMDVPVGLSGWKLGSCSGPSDYAGRTQPIGGTRIVVDSARAEHRQVCRSDGTWGVVASASASASLNYTGYDLVVCGGG